MNRSLCLGLLGLAFVVRPCAGAIIGSALLDYGNLDSASAQVYIFDGDFFPLAGTIDSYAVKCDATGYLTPILLQETRSGPNPAYDDQFTVVGVGAGRTISATGTYQFGFALQYGSSFVSPSGDYTFGFMNALVDGSGNALAASTGVVPMGDVQPGAGVSGVGTNDWRFTPTDPNISIPVGTIFGYDGIPLNDPALGASRSSLDRTYAMQASEAVPEPSTLLVWSALGGLGIVGWWRKRRTA